MRDSAREEAFVNVKYSFQIDYTGENRRMIKRIIDPVKIEYIAPLSELWVNVDLNANFT